MSYTQRAYITTTGASSYSVPADFNPSDNRITCIGNGGTGSLSQSTVLGGNGGGGGACAFSVNVALTPGATVDAQVGAGGGTTLTWLKDGVGGTILVQADFGISPSNSGAIAAAGGLVANCIGGTKFAGGSGRASSTLVSGKPGGGAAGLSGAGGNAPTNTLGGNADNNTVNGGNAAPGNNGTEWDSTHGSGSGSGGGNRLVAGRYGGGNSGAQGNVAPGAGTGFQGLIVIEYNLASSTSPPPRAPIVARCSYDYLD